MKGHIRRRGKNWELKYDVGINPATGKRKTAFKAFRGTKRAAQAELVRLLETVRKGEHVDANKLTLNLYLDDWETTWVATQVSPRTGEGYREKLRLHVRPHIGELKLANLRDGDLAGLYATLLEKGLGARTIGHVHRVTHKALQVAMERKLIANNPAAMAKPPKLLDSKEIEILSMEEARLILRGMRGHALYSMIVVLLGTGMRRGELLALRWRDVSFNAGTIRVERAVEQTKAGLRIKATKTRYSKRTIDVGPSILAELWKHRTSQAEQRLKLGLGGANADDLVFGDFEAGLRRPSTITGQWGKARKALKLPKVSLHAFRHTHASQLIASGTMDPLAISRRLGHASVAITFDIYGHLMANKGGAAAEVVEAAFGAVLAE